VGLPQGIRIKYETWWNTFEKIFAYDVNVSTLRSRDNVPLTYWTYLTSEQRIAYTNGLMLHIKRYPDSNWNVNRD
jgi:hypothetical protein